MIIAIDFDGVIAEVDEWPKIGKMVPYAAISIKRIREAGHYVIINTCRSGEDLGKAVAWLKWRKVEWDAINENHPAMIEKYGNNSRKIFADLYIDDRNLGGFPGWSHETIRWLFRAKSTSCESAVTQFRTAIKKAADHFGISDFELKKQCRKREIVDLRYMLCHYGRNELRLNFNVIGHIIGYDHATVIHGCKEVEILKSNNRPFIKKFNEFQKVIQ